MMFKFARANAKLLLLEKMTGKKVYSFSTLSGWACPQANECLSKVHLAKYLDSRRAYVVDGPKTLFRCFSASQEALFPNVYEHRKYNLDMLRDLSGDVKALADAFLCSIPKNAEIIRWHVAGDIVNQNHMDALIEVAIARPDIHFYCYTKSLPFWVKRIDIPIASNFRLIASRGGRADHLIQQYNLREVVVIADMDKWRLLNQNAVVSLADGRKLLVDHNDYKAAFGTDSFALLIHGIQPKGSKAAKAWSKIKGTIGGYHK